MTQPDPSVTPRAAMPDGKRRILVVEDDFLVGLSIAMSVRESGFEVVGPIGHIDQAHDALNQPIDGAVLDVNIMGGHTGPIAQQLEEQGTPFFFVTGYASPPIDDKSILERTETLLKPVQAREIQTALHKLFPDDPAQS
jgi:response regulator RpfG family c-di-GMP phosphodiesterase